MPVRSECYIILFSKPVTGIEPVSTAWKAAMRSEFLTEFLSHLLRRFEVPLHHTDVRERSACDHHKETVSL